MDGQWCSTVLCWLMVSAAVVVTFASPYNITGRSTEETKCLFLDDMPGYTVPGGDIVVENGTEIEIFCHLTDRNYNSSQLRFLSDNKEMNSSFVQILNNTTIRLYEQNPAPSRRTYYCQLGVHNPIKDTITYKAVCMNIIIVGTKPEKAENFSCSSYNWTTLNCTWMPKHNFVSTKYILSYSTNNSTFKQCPFNKTTNCNWTLHSDPPYIRKAEKLYFRLVVDNKFGQLVQHYHFNHYEIVIPYKQPIENLELLNSTWNSIKISWKWPPWSLHFPPGLIANISYQSQWDQSHIWHESDMVISSLGGKQDSLVTLENLAYAHAIYDIRVYVRSGAARHPPYIWSEPVAKTARTAQTIPGDGPKAEVGSYKTIVEGLENRSVLIYWRQIPEHLENGDNIRYTVQVFENNLFTKEVKPVKITKTLAKFDRLRSNYNYKFRIYATNNIGNSIDYAQVFVPEARLTPAEPESFTKIAFEHGVYGLYWSPPSNMTNIDSYTLFWCEKKKQECTGNLNWTMVSKDLTAKNVTLPEDKNYQFSISANAGMVSSGMVWASCALLKEQAADAFNNIRDIMFTRVGSNFIEVKWMLDCSLRIGVITNYVIYYCPVASPNNKSCRDSEMTKEVNVSELKDTQKDQIHYNVTGLKPYTTYMMSIAIRTKSGGLGESSQPHFQTTLEAAPDTPPRGLRDVEVSNTTVTVAWLPPLSLNGMLREYKLYWGNQVTIVKDSTQAVLTDLDSFSKYEISVAACTIACSPKSNPIQITTKIGKPGRVEDPKIRFVDVENKIVVSWKEAENVAGGVAGRGTPGQTHNYQVRVEMRQESAKYDDIMHTVNGTEFEIDAGECKNVAYNISVRAVNIDSNNHNYPGHWSPSVMHLCTKQGVTWIIVLLILMALLLCLPLLFRWTYRFFLSRACIEIKMPPPLVVRNTSKDKEMDTPLEGHIHQPRPHLIAQSLLLLPSDFPTTDQLIHLMMDDKGSTSSGGVGGGGGGGMKGKKKKSTEELLKGMIGAGGGSSSTTKDDDDDDDDDDYLRRHHFGGEQEEEEEEEEDVVTGETELKESDSSTGSDQYRLLAIPTTITTKVEGDGESEACLLRQRNIGYCQMGGGGGSAAVVAPSTRGYVMQAPLWSTKQQQPSSSSSAGTTGGPLVMPAAATSGAYCVLGIKMAPHAGADTTSPV